MMALTKDVRATEYPGSNPKATRCSGLYYFPHDSPRHPHDTSMTESEGKSDRSKTIHGLFCSTRSVDNRSRTPQEAIEFRFAPVQCHLLLRLTRII